MEEVIKLINYIDKLKEQWKMRVNTGRCIGTTETQNMHKYNNVMGANLCTTVTPEKENMYKDE